MSNETKKPETTVDFDEVSARFERTRGAILQALEQLAAANQGELYAKGDLDEAAKEHARCKAEADQLREKAEVEAFGHRFHAKLLAAMKSGSTNVVDMLGAAMEAAGILGPNGSTVAKECDDYVPQMSREEAAQEMRKLSGLNRVVRGVPPKVHRFQNLAAKKIAEPAPSALSVEERKWRKGVELALSAALGTEPDDLEDLLREVNRRLWRQAVPLGDAQVLVESKARDAALEEADRAGMSLRQYGTVADRYDSEGLKAAARTGWNAGANEVLAAIRALKSKPAPPSSASYGDFGWALQQLLAGKRVKQGDSPRSWRMREDGALVDQNGIVMRELHMDMVLAMNWRLAE